MKEAKETVRIKHTKTTREMTIERDELFVLRAVRVHWGWCHRCSTDVSLVTPEEVAAASHVSIGTIHEWIEIGRLHFSGDAAGPPRVCLGTPQSSD